MRLLLCLFFILAFWGVHAQSLRVAQSYYEQGQFEEAVVSYESLLKKNKANSQVVLGLAKSYRQLDRNQQAIDVLASSYAKNTSRLEYLVELAVTYQKVENEPKKQEVLDTFFTELELTPAQGSFYARDFKEYNFLKEAIKCYQISMKQSFMFDYSYEIALMQGELGNYGGMFSSYVDYMLAKPNYIPRIKRKLDEFITEDPESETNQIFKRTLLKKNQLEPDTFYNELLSWLFVQQKQFRKAFLQEKAVYSKTGDGMLQMVDLAITAQEHKDYETTEEILLFVIEKASLDSYTINAEAQLQKMYQETYEVSKYSQIKKNYEKLFDTYGISSKTLNLILDYGKFVGFNMDQKPEAKKFLKPILKKDLNKIDKAKIEILIADILVLEDRFNEALIYYSKAQKKVKNHPLSQEASFKIAKASYYKGDFDWAKTQLNVLKASTTQLVANDAMDLFLLIEDNTQEDSTFVALKKFAKAELYTFQEQPEKAISLYEEIKTDFKGNQIEDDALFKQAQLFIAKGELDQARLNYKKILQFFPESLLIDDAHYHLGVLYQDINEIEKAKEQFQKIIFNHANSIHYVEARKRFRRLRGDDLGE